ncbi:MAG TPA: helix-turn-helix domain-containing protein [Candidatus Thiothrix moscowensis]|uniref:helix-turn-helix domain-containing protein n=1 Tax=unclassified Thiothrix TaxID=2636184 RepID=UPI0025DBAC3C|nr:MULTISPECIES: helix-turn-helix domain-containing protein [unclassified Thiothrix]HRJ51938.1 helix-turn-helix domain-containing protein [Candidatus Thiothrix moscowensis]HRJ92253.1 helix-turn-helix domain-containing protein [Candidatus Thiothrix moscowensis]
MATTFGKFVRKLRIDRGKVLGDMAAALGLSSAYLSAVENGKKNVTDQLLIGVIDYFSLDEKATVELREAAANSQTSVKFDLQDSPEMERMLVSSFARKVRDLSPNQQGDLLDFLGKL